jgi:hypothetical protein
MGCLTGKRLRAAFGDLCDPGGIVWTEASPKIAGQSDGVFPPDLEHIHRTIAFFRPELVLAFGAVAKAGINGVEDRLAKEEGITFEVFYGPHPAARHASVTRELAYMAEAARKGGGR